MNKFVKGSIAAGVGIVLLLGGAGTFALWNGTAAIDSATVSSGKLTLAKSGTGAWSSNPAKWVPGDTFTYTDTLTVTALGDNIKSTLAVDQGTIVTGGAGGVALKNALTIVTTVTGATVASGAGTITPNLTSGTPNGTFNLVGSGTYTIPITVTVTFPSGAPAIDNATQDGAVSLANLGFVVTQHL